MIDRIGNIKGPRILTALGVFAVALSGCAVGPDYRRPDVEVPPGWPDTTPPRPLHPVGKP